MILYMGKIKVLAKTRATRQGLDTKWTFDEACHKTRETAEDVLL